MAKLEGLTAENLNKELVKAKAELESAQKIMKKRFLSIKRSFPKKGRQIQRPKKQSKADAAKVAFEKIQAEYAAKGKLMMLPLRRKTGTKPT